LALVLTMLCGGVYGAGMAAIAGLLFPARAEGSLIRVHGQVVASVLVGQPFASERYFRGRPSAVGYDPMAAGGSNLAPGSARLRARVRRRSAAIAHREHVAPGDIPADLVTASGSGIDPGISPAAALLQVSRVARARHLNPAVVRRIVERRIEPPVLGVLGQPRVNVVQLNLALDRHAPGRP